MRRGEFLDQVRRLRGEGKSIRVIAAELDVHRSRVHRALKALPQTTHDRPDLQPGWGTGNKFLLEMKDSVYVGKKKKSAGEVSVSDDAGSDFQISGTPAEFMADNTNFDISGADALLDFTANKALCD